MQRIFQQTCQGCRNGSLFAVPQAPGRLKCGRCGMHVLMDMDREDLVHPPAPPRRRARRSIGLARLLGNVVDVRGVELSAPRRN